MEPQRRLNFADAIDAFFEAQKTLPGLAQDRNWRRSYPDNGVQRLILPIQLEGEFRGQSLQIVCHVNSDVPRFNIAVNFPPVVYSVHWYAHGHHSNFRANERGSLPTKVKGNHYHPWAINRGFVKSSRKLAPLYFAAQLPDHLKDVDDTLRWLCVETNIELPQCSPLQLPPREELL